MAARTDGRRHDAADRHRPARDGRHLLGARLRAEPDAEADAGAPQGYSANLARYTAITLPHPGESVTDELAAGTLAQRERRAAGASRSSSRFATATRRTGARAPTGCCAAPPTRRCTTQALELTRDAPTLYDAVKNVELWLQDNFTYSRARAQRTTCRSMGFLEQDKRGYCQQFSGTMALMLRMAGHPGAGGGRLLARARTTRTRASTACATSTPTPGSRCGSPGSAGCRSTRRRRARRRSRSRARSPRARPRRRRRGRGSPRQGAAASEHVASGTAARRPGRDGGWIAARLLLLLVACRSRWARACRPARGAPAAAVARRAWRRCSWPSCGARSCGSGGSCPSPRRCSGSSGGSGGSAGPRSAGLRRALRAHRYDPARAGRPRACHERRALRRELARAADPLERLRGCPRDPAGRRRGIYRTLTSKVYRYSHDNHAPAVKHPLRSRRRTDRARARRDPDRHRT